MPILMTGLTGILGSIVGPALGSKEKVCFLVREGRRNKKIPAGIAPERIFDGDIILPLCGLDEFAIKRLKDLSVDKILHLAADVSFASEDADGKIFKTNLEGTKNMIELAKELKVKEFHYCSTAFAPCQRNPYEKSKWEAEKLVWESGLAWSIYRPSAMVGHSLSGATSDFNGYYGVYGIFHAIAQKFRVRENRIFGDVSLPIFVICSQHSTINLIQSDWIAETMVRLMARGAKNEIYHLTHPRPQLARRVMQFGFDILGIKSIRYLDLKQIFWEGSLMSLQKDRKWRLIQKAVDEILMRYVPYVTYEDVFSLETTRRALGCDYRDPPEITLEFLYKLLRFAVDRNFGREKVEI